MDVRTRRIKETSPDRVRVLKTCRKVQVVYYLTRNGQLEHPHFMEVSLFANQYLRLKEVMEKLTVLRGKGMPSMYSWSCKRSYKNGYVWNDLSENDVIHPAEGAEYVLKGSELIQGCTEKFEQIHINHRKPKQISPNNRYHEQVYYHVNDEDEESEEEDEKTSYTSELLEETESTQKNPTELTLTDSSPPSTSSTISEKPVPTSVNSVPVSRNSVLLQLIACGSSTVAKAKSVPTLNQPIKSVGKKSIEFRKGVLCKSVAEKAAKAGLVEEDMKMIRYMSENPRFGNLQAEEKEYFSGSIAESMTEDRVVTESVFKKSNSYNEERSCKAEIVDAAAAAEEKREQKAARGKCIPIIKSGGSKFCRK